MLQGRPTLLYSLLSLPMGGGAQTTDLNEQVPHSIHSTGTQEDFGSTHGAQAASSGGPDGLGEREGTKGNAAPQQPAPAPGDSPAGGKLKLSLLEKMRLAGLAQDCCRISFSVPGDIMCRML